MEFETESDLRAALGVPSPDRLRVVAEALRQGLSVDDVHQITAIDKWFLRQIEELMKIEAGVREHGLPEDKAGMVHLKSVGFSDRRLGQLTGHSEGWVRGYRHSLNVRPVYKRIDTCAAEFAAKTPYLYSTYEQTVFGAEEADC